MVLSDPCEGSSRNGTSGGGAEDRGIAAIGSHCAGSGEEDIYEKEVNLNMLVGSTTIYDHSYKLR
jgi:hypothetical protein